MRHRLASSWHSQMRGGPLSVAEYMQVWDRCPAGSPERPATCNHASHAAPDTGGDPCRTRLHRRMAASTCLGTFLAAAAILSHLPRSRRCLGRQVQLEFKKCCCQIQSLSSFMRLVSHHSAWKQFCHPPPAYFIINAVCVLLHTSSWLAHGWRTLGRAWAGLPAWRWWNWVLDEEP